MPTAESFLDRERAKAVLGAAGLDALVICEPEGFRYATGASQGVAGLFRRAGAGFALIPAEPGLPLGAVIGDLAAADFRARSPVADIRVHPLWIETATADGDAVAVEQAIAAGWASGRGPGFARPPTFDLLAATDALRDLLAARGLASGRLGLDLDFVPANDFAVLRDRLGGAVLVDGSPAFNRLRMVKAPGEIARLRLGAGLAEAGILELARTAAAGQTADDLRAAFRAGVAGAARQRGVATPPSWDYIGIGPDPWRPDGRVAPGAIVKVDVGCVVDGYSSDTSRNFVFGAARPPQARLHAILERAFAAGLAAIGPGRPLAGVHRAVTQALEAAGLTGFSRGHFGHSLGQAVFSEQWPFIAAAADADFEPGMVMAFEVPLYVAGIGGFNIEDQLLITPAGFESMNALPRGLVAIGEGA